MEVFELKCLVCKKEVKVKVINSHKHVDIVKCPKCGAIFGVVKIASLALDSDVDRSDTKLQPQRSASK